MLIHKRFYQDSNSKNVNEKMKMKNLLNVKKIITILSSFVSVADNVQILEASDLLVS